MASSYASLLCAEDNNSILEDMNKEGYGESVEYEATWCYGNHRTRKNQKKEMLVGFGFDDDEVFPLQSDECLALMFEKEGHHMPKNDYLNRLKTGDLDLEARKLAADWIAKVHGHFGFGPLCAYLSVNYLDRFLSTYELAKGKAWMMQLLAVACLSLAAKMEETDIPLSLDLQVAESRFLFEARTIQRMELLVMSTLRWRMQAITPFSFIDYFIRKINVDNNHQTVLRDSVLRSIQLILATLKEMEFLEFKPSEVAAAVAISVAAEAKTVDDIEKAISVLTQHVEKERLLKCYKMIQDLVLMGGSAKTSSVPQSPIGVLDAATCLSYKSNETTAGAGAGALAGSCANSSQGTPENNKRRKLNGPPCQIKP